MKPNPLKINISDLTWDQFIYPRSAKSHQTINAYAEALESVQCNTIHGDRLIPNDKKSDLIFFDPPYYSKKKKECGQKADKIPSIYSYTKKDYMKFFKDFFTLAHNNSNPTTTLAFLKADWRDFESTLAAEEKPDPKLQHQTDEF